MGKIYLMISGELLKDVAQSQKNDLQKRAFELEREEIKNYALAESFALIISGIRRCGKSTLLVQLLKNQYPSAFYLNFEDPRLYGFTLPDFQKIDKLITENKENVLFFDEIQVVDGWERY
ncbi:MAG TPA: AAA family ATPase, partial [Lunatimonas sp.]|nr:AAA family ATPase [Lunatimonas sp.]